MPASTTRPGGTAVGTGLNAPKGYAERAVGFIAALTGAPFTPAPNRFQALASHDALALLHNALEALTPADEGRQRRPLARERPRCGLGDLNHPENEPGSSIMPGKVNPTQCEGAHHGVRAGARQRRRAAVRAAGGNFELNVHKPLIAHNALRSITLLTDARLSFLKPTALAASSPTAGASRGTCARA